MITHKELVALFGMEMPLEAMKILEEAPTILVARAQLNGLAARTKQARAHGIQVSKFLDATPILTNRKDDFEPSLRTILAAYYTAGFQGAGMSDEEIPNAVMLATTAYAAKLAELSK